MGKGWIREYILKIFLDSKHVMGKTSLCVSLLFANARGAWIYNSLYDNKSNNDY